MIGGKYVRLRPMTPDDAAMCLRWRQGPRAILLNRGAQTVEQQRRWIEAQSPADYNWIIELADGKPVGMLSIIGISEQHGHGETSHFLIGEEAACKGIPVAAEAMRLLYEFAFYQLGLYRLWGYVASENVGMIRWQVYTGMVEEGRMEGHLFINGHRQDAVMLGLTVDRYHAYARARLEALSR